MCKITFLGLEVSQEWKSRIQSKLTATDHIRRGATTHALGVKKWMWDELEDP